ncbi:MAG: hypothetical protein ACR2NZ_21070 [Rubripirellula sp.]
MGMFYAYGGALIDEDEIQAKTEAGHFARFGQRRSVDPNNAVIDFSTGRMTADDVRGAMVSPVATTTPFEPIGLCRPLTIEIRHVYTGRFPRTNLFNRSSDMVLTSAIKSSPVLHEAATAMNFLRRDVGPRTGFSTPHADELGTPVVFYSPSLTQRNSSLTIKFGFDEFPAEDFDQVANALSAASGIPLFATAALHLQGASIVTRLLGRLGEKFFDERPAFRSTQSITFSRPGSSIPVANFALMMQDDEAERRILKTHVIREGQLVHAETDQPYDGDVPYVVISLDGRRNDELKQFVATSAASLMLDGLMADGNQRPKRAAELEEAVHVYHDYRLRRRADQLLQQLADETPGTADHDRIASVHAALLANITTPALQPTRPLPSASLADSPELSDQDAFNRTQPRRVA